MNVIPFCLALICVLAAQAPTLAADRTEDPVLVRRLVSRNQAIRLKTLAELESNRGLAIDSLQQLVIASQRISAAQVDRNASGTNTGGTSAGDLNSVAPYVVRLIHLIGSINDDLSEQGLIDLLDSPNSGIAMIAADTLGKHKFYDSIEFLKRQLDHPEYKKSYAFRFNLLRALIQMEHPDAIEFVAQQARSLDGQLQHKINQKLSTVTVDDFRGDEERFQEWSASRVPQNRAPHSTTKQASDAETGIIFKKASHEPESLQRIRLAKQQYYGIQIHAKRLMFIIDHSGSMEEYDGGQSRLDRAKIELNRAIDSLEEDTEFALVFYDTRIASWRNELVPATEKNKQAAKLLIRGLRPGDSTNTYGALRKSLEFDESLEAVYLLTDGRPTAGEIIRPDRIVDDILHRNQFRHLNFNTIGIALSDSTKRFLQTLAVESGGEFRAAK